MGVSHKPETAPKLAKFKRRQGRNSPASAASRRRDAVMGFPSVIFRLVPSTNLRNPLCNDSTTSSTSPTPRRCCLQTLLLMSGPINNSRTELASSSSSYIYTVCDMGCDGRQGKKIVACFLARTFGSREYQLAPKDVTVLQSIRVYLLCIHTS